VIPTALEHWSLEVVRQLAASGVLENDFYDFKADLQPADHQRKAVAAFANTGGGFLVFGVTNDRQVNGVQNAEMVRDFGNKLTTGLEPSVEYAFATPHVVTQGSWVFICHVPRSTRGPHAVLAKDAWVFYKRTASGSCVSATRDEIRSAFLDSGRRQSELAWLRADVQRIRDLAYRVNLKSFKRAYDLDVLLTRMEASQLRTLLVSVFEYIGRSSTLVAGLQELVERCGKIDVALAAMAQHAMRDRDRSYSGTGVDAHDLVRHHVPDTVMLADRLLLELDRVVK
jgi:hypothetical protein